MNFYGIDVSLGGPTGSVPTPAALEAAPAYLDRVDAVSAQHLRATLSPFLSRLPGGTFSPAEHDRLTAAIDDLVALLTRERPAYVAASSESAYDRAYHDAVVSRQAEEVFRVVPADRPGGGIPPGAWRAVSARDAAMAANVRWALAREGAGGRLLVYTHDNHAKNATTEGGVWAALERPPNAMGQYLRLDLGGALMIIGTISAHDGRGLPQVDPAAGSLDEALAHVGPSCFFVDLRPARSDPVVATWLAQRRATRDNLTSEVILSPATAFDALLYIDTLTPAHIVPTD